MDRLSIKKPVTRRAGRETGGPAGAGTGLGAQRRQVRSILKRPAFAVADPPAGLPAGTPAWTQGGRIHLAPQALLMSGAERQRVMRHEAVHSAQQRLGLRSDGEPVDSGDLQAAERQAGRLERPGAAPEPLLPAAAAVLLAYPPQNYAPWVRVWVGYTGIVGEVVEEGVTVRIHLTYGTLGIPKGPHEERTYVCGDHAAAKASDLAQKLPSLGKAAARMNAKLPVDASLRIALVAIGDTISHFRLTPEGKGLIMMGRDDFKKSPEATVLHEASHAIIEQSLGIGPAGRDPSNLSLAVADLFNKLKQTPPVPLPKARFDPANAPSLTAQGGDTEPVGLVMVSDTLWSGEGGHSWERMDEFFASALSGYLTDKDLLKTITNYYIAGTNPAIEPLRDELFDILSVVGDSTAEAEIEAPGDADVEAARTTAQSIDPPLKVTPGSGEVETYSVFPEELPTPDTIPCPQPAK